MDNSGWHKMNNVKKILIAIATLLPMYTQAIESVSVSIPDVTWKFEVKYGLLSQEPARLLPKERVLASKLKPLLTQSHYKNAWQLLQSVNTATASPALAQAKGQVALQLTHYNEAINAFNHALTSRPDLLGSHRGIAASYLKIDNVESAIKHLSKAIQLGDKDPSLFAQVAYIHMQQNRPAAAVAGFRQALFLSPTNSNYINGLIWALTETENLSEASALVQQQIDTTPNSATLWLRLGQIQLQQNNTKALASLDMALRLGNKALANEMLTAQLHLNHGSTTRAIALLKRVINSGDKKYTSNVLEAVFLVLQKDQSSAATSLIAAIKKQRNILTKPQKSALLTQEALLLASTSQSKKAVNLLEQAVKADGTNGQALIALGKLLLDKSAFNRAEMYFTRASALTTYKEQALLYNAQIATNQGFYSKAITLLHTVISNNPNRQDLLANIRLLRRLTKAQ